jgi:hypothetical protein
VIKMGPVSFGAALIVAPKSINGSLNVTFFELEHCTSGFASWYMGRHVYKSGHWTSRFFELGHLNWILDRKKLCGHNTMGSRRTSCEFSLK